MEQGTGMPEEIYDVVLHPTMRFPLNQSFWEMHPRLDSDIALGSDFRIGGLPGGVTGETIVEACSPPGLNFNPARNCYYHYAYCRKVFPPSWGPEHLRWDHDGVIHRALFVARLIHPTTISPLYSARLFFENAELRTIVPGAVQANLVHVWIVATQWRDWLTKAEAERLRDCLPLYIKNPPERVRRARRHLDHAFHAFYLDQRTASLVSGFESLLKTERHAATAQFKLRVPALAQAVGSHITADEAEDLYDDRSVYVHGRAPNYTDVSSELIERYNKFETVLRCALLRASTEVAFTNLFAADGTIRSTFGSRP
jgi:hypothetical protein